MKKSIVKKWVSTFSVLVLYTVSSIVILATAHGYTLDRDGNFVATSGIFLDSDMKDVQVFLNGIVLKDAPFPVKLSWIRPGHYTVQISKEGYIPWKKDFSLFVGQVKGYQDITLVPQEISKEVLKEAIFSLSDDVYIKDIYELWTEKDPQYARFVTSFSNPIEMAGYFNREHIIALVNHVVYIMDTDGENMHVIAQDVTQLSIEKNRSIVVQHEDNTFERYIIRE